MAPASGSAELHIANTLRLTAENFRASTLLRAAGNRFSAYHLQQSAEKLLLALLISEQIEFARKD